jgi:hypothetical protein
VALGWLWGRNQLAINTLWGGFDVALMWLWGGFRGSEGRCSAFALPLRFAPSAPGKNSLAPPVLWLACKVQIPPKLTDVCALCGSDSR